MPHALRVLAPLLSACHANSGSGVDGGAQHAAQTQTQAPTLSEPLRRAVASAMARVAECCVRAAGADGGGVAMPSGGFKTEWVLLFTSAFDLLRSPAWLDDAAKRPRHAALDAVGALAPMIPPDHLAACLPSLHPSLLACLRRESDASERLLPARALARVLAAAAAADTLEPSVACSTVSAIAPFLGAGHDAGNSSSDDAAGDAASDAAATAARKAHMELLQCCGVCATARPGETVTQLLKTLDASDSGTPGYVAPACGAFAALRHVAGSVGLGAAASGGSALAPRRDAVLATLRVCASGERDPRVRKALAQAVLALAPLGYLTLRGGWDLVLFLVRCAAVTDAEVAAYKETASAGASVTASAAAAASAVSAVFLTQRSRKPQDAAASLSVDADAVAPDELRRLGERALALLAGTLPVAEPALWPALLSCVTAPSLTGALPAVARACCDIIKRREKRGEGLGVQLALQPSQPSTTSSSTASATLPTSPQLLARCLVLLHAPHRRGGPAARLLDLMLALGPALHACLVPVLTQQVPALSSQLASTSAPASQNAGRTPLAGWRTPAAAAAWDSALMRLTRDLCRSITAGEGVSAGDAFASALCDALQEQRSWYAADLQLSGAHSAQLGAAIACLSRPLDVSRRLDALWLAAILERPDERRGVASACGAIAASHPGLVCSKLAAVAASTRKAAQPAPAKTTNRLTAFFFSGSASPSKSAPDASEHSTTADANVQHTSGTETAQERLAAVALALGAAARALPSTAVAPHLDSGVCGPLVPLFPLATTAVAKAALARAAHAAAAAVAAQQQADGGSYSSTAFLPRRDALLFGTLSLVDATAHASGGASDESVTSLHTAAASGPSSVAAIEATQTSPAAIASAAVMEVRPGCLGAPPSSWPDNPTAGVLAACLPAVAALLSARGSTQSIPPAESGIPSGPASCAPPLHLQASCFTLALRVLAAFGAPAMTAVPQDRRDALRIGASSVLCACATSVTTHASSMTPGEERRLGASSTGGVHAETVVALLRSLEAASSSRDVGIAARCAVLRATGDVLRHARNSLGSASTPFSRSALHLGALLGPLLPYIAHPNNDVAVAAADAAGALLTLGAAADAATTGMPEESSQSGGTVDNVAEARGALARCGVTPRDGVDAAALAAASSSTTGVPSACDVSFRLAVHRTVDVLASIEVADYLASVPAAFADCATVAAYGASSCVAVARRACDRVWTSCPQGVPPAMRAMLRAAAVSPGVQSAWHDACTTLAAAAHDGDTACLAALLSVATETTQPAGFASARALASHPGDNGRLAKSMLAYCAHVLLTAPRTGDATTALVAITAACSSDAYGHRLLTSDACAELRATVMTAVLCTCGAAAAAPPNAPPVKAQQVEVVESARPIPRVPTPSPNKRRSDALLAHAIEQQQRGDAAEENENEGAESNKEAEPSADAPGAASGPAPLSNGSTPSHGGASDMLQMPSASQQAPDPCAPAGTVISALRLAAASWGDEALALAVEDCVDDLLSAASQRASPTSRLAAAITVASAVASALVTQPPPSLAGLNGNNVREQTARAVLAACSAVIERASGTKAPVVLCGGEAAVAAALASSLCCAYSTSSAGVGDDAPLHAMTMETARAMAEAVTGPPTDSVPQWVAAPGFRAACMRGLAALLTTNASSSAAGGGTASSLISMVLGAASGALGDAGDAALLAAAADAVRDCLSASATRDGGSTHGSPTEAQSEQSGGSLSFDRITARLCDAALGSQTSVRVSATHAVTAWLCLANGGSGTPTPSGTAILPAIDTANACRLLPGLLIGAGIPAVRNASLTALRALLMSSGGMAALFSSNSQNGEAVANIAASANDFESLARQLPPALHRSMASQLYGDVMDYTADTLAQALRTCAADAVSEAVYTALCASALLGTLLAAMPVEDRQQRHVEMLTDVASGGDLTMPAVVRGRALTALAGLVHTATAAQ